MIEILEEKEDDEEPEIDDLGIEDNDPERIK
jgi:hypothetical protein